MGKIYNYIYDANGSMIRKIANNGAGAVTTTDYIDGFVYVNSTLSYFAIPEGRIVNNGGNLVPEYVITDQQGNARITFNNTSTGNGAKVIQENSYYGFGMVMPGSVVATPVPPNNNLYNGGSELQNDFSDLPNLMQTFYRNYDAVLGRWTGVDPEAESKESLTTYQYAANNPIKGNDPKGNKVQIPDQGSLIANINYLLANGGGSWSAMNPGYLTSYSSSDAYDEAELLAAAGFGNGGGGGGGGNDGSVGTGVTVNKSLNIAINGDDRSIAYAYGPFTISTTISNDPNNPYSILIFIGYNADKDDRNPADNLMETYYSPDAFVGYNFLQTVSTSNTNGTIIDGTQLEGPYYISNQTELDATLGYSEYLKLPVLFGDNPQTPSVNYSFNAQTTFVGIDNFGGITPIATFNWGFSITDGIPSVNKAVPNNLPASQGVVINNFNIFSPNNTGTYFNPIPIPYNKIP